VVNQLTFPVMVFHERELSFIFRCDV